MRFRILNLALLLLFGWTLSETTEISVRVSDGVCTATLVERSTSIPCPDIANGQAGRQIGFFYGEDDRVDNPWRFFWQSVAPDSSWSEVGLSQAGGGEGWVERFDGDLGGEWQVREGAWRARLGELQPVGEPAVIQRSVGVSGDFVVQASLRRAEVTTGVLLLRDDGQRGWLLLTDGRGRRATWWRWEDGQATRAIVGVPFQKSLLAQSQALIRILLRGHQGALLLLLAGRTLALIWGWLPAGRRRSARPRVRLPGLSDRALVVVVTLLVFGTATVVAGDLLARIPHVQDSITYLFQAQTLAKGRLWAPAPAEPAAFAQEFLLVEGDRWFGKYSPGFPLALVPGVWLGAPWLVSPWLAALTVPLLFVLGKRLFGRRIGRLTINLALISPFFLVLSGTLMAHAAELFWITLAMVTWIQALRTNRRFGLWAAVAGGALGLGFLTRQLSAVVIGVLFIGLTTLFPLFERVWRERARRALTLSLAAGPLLLALFAYQWAVTGDPFRDPRLMFWSYDRLGLGQNIGQGQNVFTYSYDDLDEQAALTWSYDPSQPPRGHTLQRGLYNTIQNWRQLESRLFGWLPLFTLAYIWVLFITGRARRFDWLLLLSIVGLVGAYVFYWADGIMYGPRYYYVLLPAFLLLTARGIQAAQDWVGGPYGRAAFTFLTLLFVAGSLTFYLPQTMGNLRGFNFTDSKSVELVQNRLAAESPAKAIVLVTSETADWWEYGNLFLGNTPWLDGRIIYARELDSETNASLLAAYPERTAYRLRNRVLTPLNLR